MKRSTLRAGALFVAVNSIVLQASSAAESSAKDEEIHQTARAFVEAFDSGNAAAVAALWTDDGDYIADHATVKVLARLLTHRSLGSAQGAAPARIRAVVSETLGTGVLALEVPVSNPSQADRVRTRVLALLTGLAKRAPLENLLTRAIEEERTSFWLRFETPTSRALTLARCEAQRGDARHALRDLSQLERVRAADVSRVVRTRLLRDPPVLLVAAPGESE